MIHRHKWKAHDVAIFFFEDEFVNVMVARFFCLEKGCEEIKLKQANVELVKE